MTADIEQVDVLVSGGGIAGLMTAAAFGAEGLTTVCVDPAPLSPARIRLAQICARPHS